MVVTKQEIQEAYDNVRSGKWSALMFEAWVIVTLRQETYQAFDDGFTTGEHSSSVLGELP
jgi:hypothetical protein